MFNLSRREVRFTIVISAAHLSQHFLIRLIPPLIPVLLVALEYPLWQLGLLISLFSFGFGIAQTPWGILSDQYDRLSLLPSGIAAAGVGYILFALSPEIGTIVPTVVILGHAFVGEFVMMCFSMLVVGLGAAVVHPAGYPMITDNVAPENKGKVLGAFGGSAKFGDASAPAIVGVLILVLIWDQILLILGVVGILLGILLYVILRRDEFETVPAAKQSAAESSDVPSSSIWEDDRRTYMYPLAIIYLFFIAKNFSGEGIKTYLPAFIVAVYAYSFDLGSVRLTPESVASFYFAILLVFAGVIQFGIGGLTDRTDVRYILIGGVAVAAMGFLGLSLLELGPLLILIPMFMIGIGIYGLGPARDALISEISPPELEGRTFGYIWTAISLTASLMPPVVGYIIETMGMREGFLFLTLGVVISAGFASLLFFDRFYRIRTGRSLETSPSN